MPKTVHLSLTLAEARELSYLAGDLFSDQTELKARIGGRRFKTAASAMGKLFTALHGAPTLQSRSDAERGEILKTKYTLKTEYVNPDRDATPADVVNATIETLRSYLHEPCLVGRPFMEERLSNALAVLEAARGREVEMIGLVLMPLITQHSIASEILGLVRDRIEAKGKV